ncbi:MAG: BrnT family toxin [Candidatus Methylumidiphilus sp.]
MRLTWDETKRQATLRDRGLDYADAETVFAGPVFEFEDVRRDYGERRMVCCGLLAGRMVVVGYVQRGEESRHVFTMRKANEREIEKYRERLG